MAVTTSIPNGKRPVGLQLLQISCITCINLATPCISQLYNKLTGIETTFANFVITASQNSQISCKTDLGCCCLLQNKEEASVPMAFWLRHCFAMMASEDLQMRLNTNT